MSLDQLHCSLPKKPMLAILVCDYIRSLTATCILHCLRTLTAALLLTTCFLSDQSHSQSKIWRSHQQPAVERLLKSCCPAGFFFLASSQLMTSTCSAPKNIVTAILSDADGSQMHIMLSPKRAAESRGIRHKLHATLAYAASAGSFMHRMPIQSYHPKEIYVFQQTRHGNAAQPWLNHCRLGFSMCLRRNVTLCI